MKLSKKSLIIFLFYISLTTFNFLGNFKNKDQLFYFFFQDTNVKYQLEAALAFDPNIKAFPPARAFHNKVFAYLDTFTISIYRVLDPSTLFSFSKSYLFDDQIQIAMLYPIEFPFFLFSVYYLINNWTKLKKKYYLLIPIFIFSLLICGLILPRTQILRVFPLLITIRLVIFIGMFEALINSKWQKKYLSFL